MQTNVNHLEDVMNDVITLASLVKEQTEAKVILYANAWPLSYFPERLSDYGVYQYAPFLGNWYYNKNKILINLTKGKESQGIYYCPTYYVQGYDTADNKNVLDIYDNNIGYTNTNNVHPREIGYLDWGLQMYSMLCYLCGVE